MQQKRRTIFFFFKVRFNTVYYTLALNQLCLAGPVLLKHIILLLQPQVHGKARPTASSAQLSSFLLQPSLLLRVKGFPIHTSNSSISALSKIVADCDALANSKLQECAKGNIMLRHFCASVSEQKSDIAMSQFNRLHNSRTQIVLSYMRENIHTYFRDIEDSHT